MTASRIIYLDHQATTPVDPRVLKQMLPYFTECFGNAASTQHGAGQNARMAVEEARAQVAALISGDSREIIFCSGATEANNLALKGLATRLNRNRLIVLATEHPAVLEAARSLRASGLELIELGVDAEGQPSLDELQAVVDDRTLLVSIAAANNEIGTLPPLREIAAIAHARGALFHTDAAQAAGKVKFDVVRDEVDLLSLSSHKLYGPKGIGALFVKRNLQQEMRPLVDGGGHERGLRSGTLNVPGIVGFGAAAELSAAEMAEESEQLRVLDARLLERLRDGIEGLELNGPTERRLPGNLNVRVPSVDAEALIANCPSLAFSAGSACSATTPTPSHVLTAIGLDQRAAEQSIRLSVGRSTTIAEVDTAVELLTAAAGRIKALTLDQEPMTTR